MRRAERLFDIIQALRGGRCRTAAELAAALEVSPRTIYRDIADLVGSGVPIDGAAGVGYVLRPGYLLPPVAFTADERQALALGVRLAAAFGDAALAAAAAEALVKLDAAGGLPLAGAGAPALHGYGLRLSPAVRERLAIARRALDRSLTLLLVYETEDGRRTERRVRPLSLEFWGHAWTLTAWCEEREDFRVFRLDRMVSLHPGEPFRAAPGRTLADYHRALTAEGWAVDRL